VAEQQAQAAGHDLEGELMLLAVHGVLHLLGFDHEYHENKAQMWARQAEILRVLGLDPEGLQVTP
jgi:probable rRNA maturation factor